ncbi:cupin domain-containing protein [Deinococcus sp. KSM4-11]|uniref:helix-turn-helix domain-containing protein n=1 Tax=Deinococcus sp. KSM4-11 TaxID=2568654 RepID=UPI0010A2F64C|nr:XRE family transcriptional regulator [Deinococcus sp. KSM4-11]THF85810.1 cupin domain-containing protein [Deinococcus sp. KSM4-11]
MTRPADPHAADPQLQPRIGPRLRAARKARGLTLEQLVALTGLDKSFLSRMERDLTSASVASLVNVCAALGIRPGTLFDPPTAHLIRAADAPPVNFGGHDVHEVLLSQGLGGELMVLRSTIDPGGYGGEELYTLDADVSFVTVLSGQLEVMVEDAHYFLGAGDSLTLSSRIPHNWRNPTRTATEVIWITSPHP